MFHIQSENSVTGTHRGKVEATPGLSKKDKALSDVKNTLHAITINRTPAKKVTVNCPHLPMKSILATPAKRFDAPVPMNTISYAPASEVEFAESKQEVSEDDLHHDHDKCEEAFNDDLEVKELKLPKEIVDFYSDVANLFRFRSVYHEECTTAMPDIEVSWQIHPNHYRDSFYDDSSVLDEDSDISIFVPPLL